MTGLRLCASSLLPSFKGLFMGKNRDWKFERDLRKDGSITVGGDVDYNVDPILKRGSTMEVERSIGKGLLSPLDEASPSKRSGFICIQ